MKTIITLLLLCGAAVAQTYTITPNPGDPIKSGGASPAGSNGDVQMKSGAALTASPLNCSGGTACTGSMTALGAGQMTSYNNIAAWGDSLTAGTGGTAYPTQLSTVGYFGIYNGGAGGETSTQVKTRFLADTTYNNWFQIIWVGTNNYTATATILSDIAAMVAAMPSPKRYLIMSVINDSHTAAQWNTGADYHYFTDLATALAAAYPNNYLDIRSTLVAAYNPGIPQDVIDHSHDVPPSSLQPTDVHLNTAGYLVVANAVNAWLVANAQFNYVLTLSEVRRLVAGGAPLGAITAAPAFVSEITIGGKKISISGNNNYQFAAGLYPTADQSYDLGYSTGDLRWNNAYVVNSHSALLLGDILPGSAPSVNATSCTGATIGANSNNLAGTIAGLPTGSCTVTLTFSYGTVPHGRACAVSNMTTGNLFRQTASGANTVTFSGTSVSGDVLVYGPCAGY